LYCDTRIGGKKRWVLGNPQEANVRVPDEIKRCVCFLCVKINRNGREVMEYGGTAFFVSIPGFRSENGLAHTYLVTAKHCVEQAKKYGELYLRMNTKAGGSEFVKVTSEWVYPDNEAVDVAINYDMGIPDIFDTISFSTQWFAVGEVIPNANIGIGDELFISGLFTQHFGTQRNLPIIRTGIIAAMPEEPLEDKSTGLSYDAYLAESRSIDGLSGSPVFVVTDTNPLLLDISEEPSVPNERSIYLLGLIRGHWDIETQTNPVDFAVDAAGKINMGIAIITPIQEVLTLLERDDLVKARRESEREYYKRYAPTLDSTFGTIQSDIPQAEKPESFQRFENVVRQVLSVSKDELNERIKQEKGKRQRRTPPPASD